MPPTYEPEECTKEARKKEKNLEKTKSWKKMKEVGKVTPQERQ